MQRLKSRNIQVPNGFTYRQPEIGWDSRRVLGLHPSFDTLTRSLMSARKANPHHAAKHRWALDYDGVAMDVELFQVKICLANGWTKYLTEVGGGGAPPFSIAQSLQNQKQLGVAVVAIKKLWAGIQTINQWLESNAPAVSSELSESRAKVCLRCPYNNMDSLTDWFIIPAAGAIKRQLERLQQRGLKTSVDDKIGICAQKKAEGDGGCLCSLKLSVHIPIEIKLNHLDPETKAKLHPSCWVISEEKSLKPQSA